MSRGKVLTGFGLVLGILATGGDQAGAAHLALMVPAGLLMTWGMRLWQKDERSAGRPGIWVLF